MTGGSGFIGSHVVDRLLAAGIEPRIFDLVPSPYHDGAAEMVVGDLLDAAALRRAMEGCDAVIHLAAAADVGTVVEAPAHAEQTNARGTLMVLEAARDAGVRRVVYGSTSWVYGESGGGTIDEDAARGGKLQLEIDNIPRHQAIDGQQPIARSEHQSRHAGSGTRVAPRSVASCTILAITCSGVPLNFARSSGLWVAMPVGQLLR